MALDIRIPAGKKIIQENVNQPVKEEFLKTKESDAVLVAIDNYKKTDMSMNPKKRETILKLFDTIAEIESRSRNIISEEEDSTAKGYFQFNDPSIPTAINRYKNLTNTSPEWLNNLEKNKNIMALDYDQQKALAIANIAFQEGDTINDMDKIASSGQVIGNQDVYDLYMNYHHTKSGTKESQQRAKKNAYEILGLFDTTLKQKPEIPKGLK